MLPKIAVPVLDPRSVQPDFLILEPIRIRIRAFGTVSALGVSETTREMLSHCQGVRGQRANGVIVWGWSLRVASAPF